MKSLQVHPINLEYSPSSFSEIASKMTHLEWNDLEYKNWEDEYPSQTQVKFQIAYQNTHILLHYVVQEEYIKSNYTSPNENVWEDSCVEFFISFDNRKTYYNLEFNILGTGLIGYGTSIKNERKRLENEDILKVDTYTQVRNIQGNKEWEIILAIPLSIFSLNYSAIQGTKAYANFYKCGDGLPNPHFLSWNKVDNPTPNFHLLAHFGEINFQ